MNKVSTENRAEHIINQEEQPIRALIVDDEALARQGLAVRLEQDSRVELLRSCKNGREALEAIAELEPDLIFLDIQMPGMSGFDVVERLQQDNMPLVVFVTAYDEYAIKAFEVHAVDYLLKPIEQERLQQALDHVSVRLAGKRDQLEKQRLMDVVIRLTGRSEDAVAELMVNEESVVRYSEKLAIKDGSSTTFVPVRDIDWIDAAGDYMCVHVKGETHIMRTTMKELESSLDPNLFQRVHRSTIVNLDRVEIRGHTTFGKDVVIDINVILEGDNHIGDRVRIGPNTVIKNSRIGSDTCIEAFSHLEDCEIQLACQIGPYARLRPGTVLCDKAKIGNFVETKKTVIGKGSKVNHLSYIGDAQVDEAANVGAGTITCNYDGVNKYKTHIKSNAFIGSNTALVAPVTVGMGATTGAGSVITSDIPDGQLAIGRGKQRNIPNWKRPTKKTD